MKFLGIDPGIERTGFGIIDIHGSQQSLVEYGVIRTSQQWSIPQRLQALHTDLHALLQRHEHTIACVGVEELFFSKNAKTAIIVGEARGVILFTLQSFGLTIEEVKPVQVKQAVTGSGRGDKREVQKMIQLLFHLDSVPTPDDAADAIAIAWTIAARAVHCYK
ncbi:MAG TPA: crossover junction endodeoxyribonuclease RuvC [Patescibacteria group bacterium]|nr:crossover junction endodeoxyribonuclease RuvC [Patescibacteria group bacterium]